MGNWIGLRTALPLLFVMAAALALNIFLTSAKSEASFAAVEDSRFRFIVERVKGAIQNNLDLGLSLEGLASAQAILQGEIRADGVLALTIANAAGQRLFSAGTPPEQLPSDSLNVRTELTDNLGRVVGSVVLNFSAVERKAFQAQMREDMISSALKAYGAATAAILLAAAVLLGRVQRRLDDLVGAIGAVNGAADDKGSATETSLAACGGASRVLEDAEQRLTAIRAAQVDNGTPAKGTVGA